MQAKQRQVNMHETAQGRREFGQLQGKIAVHENFKKPLSDEELNSTFGDTFTNHGYRRPEV
jgi:hypothetical protein